MLHGWPTFMWLYLLLIFCKHQYKVLRKRSSPTSCKAMINVLSPILIAICILLETILKYPIVSQRQRGALLSHYRCAIDTLLDTEKEFKKLPCLDCTKHQLQQISHIVINKYHIAAFVHHFFLSLLKQEFVM